MDPTACYHQMLCAMTEGDYEEARAYAQNLRTWLIGGGFYPINSKILEVDGHLARVLRITTPGAPPEPEVFSLTCLDCDAGGHIQSEAEAIEEGWTSIQPQPDLAEAYYLGICPYCLRGSEDEES